MTNWRRLLVPTRTHSCRRCGSAAWAAHVSPQRSDTWNRRYCAVGTGRGRRINMDRPNTNTPHRRDRGAGGRRRRTPEHPHGAGSRTTQHTPAALTDAEREAWRAMTAADTQLRQTLLGLPSMIGLVLHVAHKKQLAKILDEADAAT